MMKPRTFSALCTALILIAPLGSMIMEWPAAPGTPGDEPSSTDAGTYWNELSAPYQEGSANLSWSYETSKDLALEDGALTCGAGQTGYLLSLPVGIAYGKVWDFAWADFGLDDGEVRLEVRDPDTGAYPTNQLVARVVADSPDDILAIDLNDIDVEAHGRLQLAIVLDHSGGVGIPPTLRSWKLGQQDADMWHDSFMGVGRDSESGDLSVRNGRVMPVSTHIPGGLLGDYYDSLGFSNYELTRLDQTIDFNWGNGAPDSGMGANRFSIRWEGKIMVPAPDTYTFYLLIDDGGRMWIDDTQIINEWYSQSPTEHSGQMYLTEGLHDIKIEYFENTGGAVCRFRWSSSSFSKETVPHTALWGRNATNVLVSEAITLPEGHRWDYMTVSKYGRGGNPLLIDILDARTDSPISGYVNLRLNEIDLRSVSSSGYPSIKFRARWPEGPPIESSVLQDWAVKWIRERTWRCEFLTDMRVAGSVGMMMEPGYARAGVAYDSTDLMAFARTSNATVPIYDSTVWRKSYFSQDLPTSNASDTAVADMDGDGIGDVIFTNVDRNVGATAFRGTTKGFSSAPTWTFPHSPGASDAAWFSVVVVEDIDGDGGADVILAESNQSGTWMVDNILFYMWNGSGWNATPDRVVGTGKSIRSLDAGDIDGDGWADLVFSLKGNRLQGDDTFVLWGGVEGYGTDDWEEIGSGAAKRIIVDFLDSDGYEDVGYLGGDTVYVYFGSSSGIDPFPEYQNTFYFPEDLTFADWNGDGNRDVVTCGIHKVQIHLNPFGTSPSDMVDLDTIKRGLSIDTVRVGTAGVEGLVVGTRNAPFPVDGDVYVVFKKGSIISTHTIPMDGIVAVASGEMFPMGVHTLRTAIIDVGDVSDVGNWSHFSYRMASNSPTAYQSLEARLVDAMTGEVLWSDTFTNAEASVRIDPPVHAREHPRVYLDVFAKNLDEWNEMSLGHLEINWTERFHAPPKVLSIETAADVIYRTNSTTLTISVEDEIDPPGDLEVNVQMQTPGAGGWLSDRLSIPEWDGAVWTVTFYTTRDDPVGDYSFRVRVIDTDMVASEYLKAVGLVTVLNNPPGTPSIAILPETPGSADDLTCDIVRQAYDRDTSHLDYNYTWYRDGQATNLDGPLLRSNDTAKGQVWRVTVRAFDGQNHGGLVEASVTIGNTPPRILAPLEPVLMLEDDDTYTIRLADHFVDPDGDDLLYEIVGTTELEMDLENGRLSITPLPDWYGNSEVQLNVSDGVAWLVVDLVVDVESIPDPPVVVSVGGVGPVDGRFRLEAIQDERSTYLVVVTDVDSTKFRFRSDGDFASFTVIAGNGTIKFMPTNGEVGDQRFNLSIEDETGSSTVVPIDITVANVNDPPGVVTILQPKQNMVFEHDATILLQGSCKDPDELHGQALFFTWSSDIAGELGSGTSLHISDLVPGTHKITLQVSDGEIDRESSVRIRVKESPDDPNGGGGGGGGDDDPFNPVSGGSNLMWFLLALVLIILVGVLVLYRTKLRRTTTSNEEETGPPKDDAIKMVEGIPMTMLGEAAVDTGPKETGTDMRSLMLGSSRASTGPEEAIPSSPWSAEELRKPVAPPAKAPTVGSTAPSPAKASAEAAGWVEAPEAPPAPRVQQPPPPPPPPAGQPPVRPPPPKKPTDLEVEWEEV